MGAFLLKFISISYISILEILSLRTGWWWGRRGGWVEVGENCVLIGVWTQTLGFLTLNCSNQHFNRVHRYIELSENFRTIWGYAEVKVHTSSPIAHLFGELLL